MITKIKVIFTPSVNKFDAGTESSSFVQGFIVYCLCVPSVNYKTDAGVDVFFD